MERNAQVASQLRQIGALLEEQGVAFKPAAYRRAAQVVEDLGRDVGEFKDEKELTALPGIGPAIAGKIFEFVQTGRIKKLDELMAEQGGLSPALMAIEDMGPKRARQLQTELGINTVEDLIKAAEAGKLRSLPRMSELMEKKILANAKRVAERTKRFPRQEVKADAELLLNTIADVPGVERAEIAGSYRRGKETVGDIDILVVTPHQSPAGLEAGQASEARRVSDAIAALPIVRDVVAHSEKKLSFNFTSGLRVDVRFVNQDQWGSALLYFTGDKEHNIALRKIAIGKGWKLNEYGLFEGDKVIASKEEKDIYEKLGLPYIEPTNRTGML